jgi:hypothetical protein
MQGTISTFSYAVPEQKSIPRYLMEILVQLSKQVNGDGIIYKIAEK